MAAGANFAWANRQMITEGVRAAFHEVFAAANGPLELPIVYDIAHNMAKEEMHPTPDGVRRVLVHRKGATRAFPPAGRKFRFPIAPRGNRCSSRGTWARPATSWSVYPLRSNAPLAPRVTARGGVSPGMPPCASSGSTKVTRSLTERGIIVRAATREGVTEEAPGAYKNVEDVVRSAEGAGGIRWVARLVPMGVVKG